MFNFFLQVKPKVGGLSGTFGINVRFKATKTGTKSKNGRDTPGRRYGLKIRHNQECKEYATLWTQSRRFPKKFPGFNVFISKDKTLLSKIPGFVKYYETIGVDGRKTKYVGVEPFGVGNYVRDIRAEQEAELKERVQTILQKEQENVQKT